MDITAQIHSIMRQINCSILTQGAVGLKPMLKSLYCLMQSSLSYNVGQDDYGNAAVEDRKLKLENMTTLSSMLFEELRERLSFGIHRTSIDRDVDRAASHPDSRDLLEELLLLLRCCVLIVRLHPHDHTLMRKFLDAVSLRRMLPFRSTQIERGSISFTKMASSQSMYSSCSTSLSNDLSAKSCDSCILLLKRLLEVILDEMFADRQFREHIAMLYTFSSTHGNQYTCSSTHIESLLDVITAHFILSVSGEDFLETFTRSFIWTKKGTFCNPQLSLSAAISLVKHPLMSPPILLRAHLISLVSEVVGICDSHDVSPNLRYMEYLSVFHDSIIMYCEHMSKLLGDPCGSPFELRRSRRAVKPHFHSDIYDKVNFMLTGCDSSWRVHVGNISVEANSSLEADAITYLKMNINIFDESSRDEALSFLSSLIRRVISSEVDEILYLKIKKMTMQDFCLLASVLKLMSCSLLQATCLNKRLSLLALLSKIKHASPGCQSVVGMLNCIAKYNLHLPVRVQQLIDDALKPHHTKLNDSKMILMHFAGLLSLCKVVGMNFLMKGCLFTIMVFMNMVIFEGGLEFLRPSSNSSPESHAPASSMVNLTSVPTRISSKDSFGRTEKNRSSLKVALDFQRIRKLFLRDHVADEDAESANGEVYLKHFINDPDVIADLADFIVCKPERDYTSWLRNRAESRRKRSKKFARQRWQRKKVVCNSIGRESRRKVRTKLRSQNWIYETVNF